VTYAGFAEASPSHTDRQGYADRINGLPKVVVTTTLDKPEWNNSTAIRGKIAEEVNKLKQ
jgi:hypothetical protein